MEGTTEMPHDANGLPVKKGDLVNVPCIVNDVQLGEEYCNCTLETVHAMYPGENKTSIVVNAKQVVGEKPTV
jgi:hypothetical protein